MCRGRVGLCVAHMRVTLHGVCRPLQPIAMGLAAAIRDRFLDIKEVKIHTEEEEDKPAA